MKKIQLFINWSIDFNSAMVILCQESRESRPIRFLYISTFIFFLTRSFEIVFKHIILIHGLNANSVKTPIQSGHENSINKIVLNGLQMCRTRAFQ